MALGAGSGHVLRMVLSYGGMLMAVGVLLGVPMALRRRQVAGFATFRNAVQRPDYLRRGIGGAAGDRSGGLCRSGIPRHRRGPHGSPANE